MKCETSISFFVLVNGKQEPPFKPSSGLRQGGPLSPYLFILVCEVLSTNLNKCIEGGWIKGVKLVQRSAVLSHLFFANDSLFFLKADETNYRFMDLLEKYCTATGQLVNQSKFNLFFSSNTP